MYGVHVTTSHRSAWPAVGAIVVACAVAAAAPAAAQREFRVYPSFEGDVAEAPLPPDYQVPGELVVGHLMFPDSGFGRGSDWRRGGTGWTDDYPKGDRALIQMLRRFTSTDVRPSSSP